MKKKNGKRTSFVELIFYYNGGYHEDIAHAPADGERGQQQKSSDSGPGRRQGDRRNIISVDDAI